MNGVIFLLSFTAFVTFGTGLKQEKNSVVKYKIDNVADFLSTYNGLKGSGTLTYDVSGDYDNAAFRDSVCSVIGHDWDEANADVDFDLARSTDVVNVSQDANAMTWTVLDHVTRTCRKCKSQEITSCDVDVKFKRTYK